MNRFFKRRIAVTEKRLVLLRVAISLAVCAPAVADAATFFDVGGARIIGQTQVSKRTIALAIETPSMGTSTMVEVMLPNGYDADPRKRWPVTYYLAGTGHKETDFRTVYGGEDLTANYPSIIVAPRGESGYWSDWFNAGAGGPPMYETFVSSQLIPLIDANFRTFANRANRVILGESMGGYGVIMLTARHPDLFVAASSLSGAVDTNLLQQTAVTTVSPALMTNLPDAIYGPRLTEEVRWRGHNPVDLVDNLHDVQLQVRTGNGFFDISKGETAAELAGCSLEAAGVLPESTSLHNTLMGRGISHEWQVYPWGCHSVALFRQEIGDSLPRLLAAFGTLPPSAFDYRSVEPSFGVYGWKVSADPVRAMEFLVLRNVSNYGFTIEGSGTAMVTTPPIFKPSRQVTVVVNGTETGAWASESGQITFAVNLGPPNTQQQYRVGSANPTKTAIVRLAQH